MQVVGDGPSSVSIDLPVSAPEGGHACKLLDQVVTSGRRDHLLVVDMEEAGNLPDGGSIVPELIGTDRVWDIVFSQKSRHKVLGGLGIAVSLEQDTLHEAVLVDRPPQPMPDPVHTGTDLVQKPPRTPMGFPVTQAICEERAELDGSFTEGFVTDLNTALVQQFLDVSIVEREAVIEPDSVLDNRHGETVAVGLGIGHSGSAYPDPVKATQLLAVFVIKASRLLGRTYRWDEGRALEIACHLMLASPDL